MSRIRYAQNRSRRWQLELLVLLVRFATFVCVLGLAVAMILWGRPIDNATAFLVLVAAAAATASVRLTTGFQHGRAR